MIITQIQSKHIRGNQKILFKAGACLREADCNHQAFHGNSKILILLIFLPDVALDK